MAHAAERAAAAQAEAKLAILGMELAETRTKEARKDIARHKRARLAAKGQDDARGLLGET